MESENVKEEVKAPLKKLEFNKLNKLQKRIIIAVIGIIFLVIIIVFILSLNSVPEELITSGIYVESNQTSQTGNQTSTDFLNEDYIGIGIPSIYLLLAIIFWWAVIRKR